jgi:hypothetical protein
MNECRVCLGPHDEDTHLATVRVHDWFRSEIERTLAVPEDFAVQPPATENPAAA